MKPSYTMPRMLLAFAFSAFLLIPSAFAAPKIDFEQAPGSEFRVYEGSDYSVTINLTDLKHPTLVHMYVAGPLGSTNLQEYLVESYTYETEGNYIFSWDGQIDGHFLEAGKYELRFKSGGLYQDEKSALSHQFQLTAPFHVTVGNAGDGSSNTGNTTDNGNNSATDGNSQDDEDIEFNLASTEPICAELRIDGEFYKLYEALESGDHEIDVEALTQSQSLEAGSHEWALYVDGSRCGGSDEDEQMIASGRFAVVDQAFENELEPETDYSVFCGQFTDIEPNHPDCPAIGYVYSIGAMTGYPDGTFRPDKVLQRDESAKISLKAFDLFVDGTDYCKGTDPYPDVLIDGPDPDWSAQYVCRGTALGMITGYEGGEEKGLFVPARLVNFAEFLALILRNLNEPMPSINSTSYANVPSGQWYSGFFKFAHDHSLLDASDVAPRDGVSRLQVAKALYKLHLLEKL